MGRKYVLTDDLDGKELPDDIQPVRLSLGRTTYNLYLSEDNHGKLLKALDPFIKDAETERSSSSTGGSGSDSKPSAADKADQRNARAWAIESGFKYPSKTEKDDKGEPVMKSLGDRGRIPKEVMEGWQAAGSPTMGSSTA